jgi:hypothetical protein
MPGGHITVIVDPYSRALTERLKVCMDRIHHLD